MSIAQGYSSRRAVIITHQEVLQAPTWLFIGLLSKINTGSSWFQWKECYGRNGGFVSNQMSSQSQSIAQLRKCVCWHKKKPLFVCLVLLSFRERVEPRVNMTYLVSLSEYLSCIYLFLSPGNAAPWPSHWHLHHLFQFFCILNYGSSQTSLNKLCPEGTQLGRKLGWHCSLHCCLPFVLMLYLGTHCKWLACYVF